MGTDISLYAEKRQGEVWQPVPKPHVERGRKIPVEALDLGRPYGLFSLLSGNSVGLRSGLVAMPPFFPPRGLPDDLNPLYKKKFKRFYDPEGDWGASWIGLEELEAIDWEQKLLHHAYVESKYAGLFQADEPYPAQFPKDAKLFHGLFGPPPASTSKVNWSIPLRDYVGCGEWFVQQLSALASGAELRIIFWFNS